MRSLSWTALLAVFCSAGWAAELVPPANVVAASYTLASDYVTPIGTHSGRTSHQGYVEYSRYSHLGHRTYFGLWGSGGAGPFGDEFDIYGGCDIPTSVGVLNAEGLLYNLEPVTIGPKSGELWDLGLKHTWELGSGLSGALGGRWFQPHDFPARGAPVLFGEVTWKRPVAARTELEYRQRVGHDWGVFGFSQTWLANSRATVSHSFDSLGATKVSAFLDGSGALGNRDRGYFLSAGLVINQSFGF